MSENIVIDCFIVQVYILFDIHIYFINSFDYFAFQSTRTVFKMSGSDPNVLLYPDFRKYSWLFDRCNTNLSAENGAVARMLDEGLRSRVIQLHPPPYSKRFRV